MPDPTARVAVALLAALLMGCGGPGGASPASAPRTSAPTSTPTQPADRSSPPVALRIDDIDLDEDLIDLGLTEGGALEVPKDSSRVGWFTGGGRPGGRGPTVLVGHLDSATGPAVFARLPQLRTGDEIEVTTADDTEVTYRVTSTEDVPQDRFPTEDVFGATPDDELRLITCTGPYDRAAGRYTENRIVRAVAIDDQSD